MINMRYALPVGLLTCLAVISSYAQLPTVPEHSTVPTKSRPAEKISRLGDPAPPIVVAEWAKGAPVNFAAGTNIVVLELGAALSPKGRAVIPTLNETQKKFKDKNVVVVAIAEEPVDQVRAFVQNEGGSIEFRVAVDKERETGRNYLVPFGGFIPHVFILDGGKVVWHGYPSAALDRALDGIINKTYNLAEAIREDALRADLNEYQILARRGDAKAKELGAKLLTGATTNVSELSQLAYFIVADFHNTNRDFALAREALERADKASGGKAPKVMFTQGMMLFEEGKQEEGIAKAKKAIEMTANTNEAAILTRYLDVMEVRAQTKGQNSDSSEKKLDAVGAAPPPNRAVSPVGTN